MTWPRAFPLVAALYTAALPSPVAAQVDLAGVADRLSASWVDDLDAWTAWMAQDVAIYVHSESHYGLTPRQAVASLKGVRSQHVLGITKITRVSEAGGDPARGFAELHWETVARGTSEPIMYTVFIGLTWTGSAWRVHEVRVIRR